MNDLLGYLLKAYKESEPKDSELDTSSNTAIKDFVEFARKVLKETPPVGIGYAVRGLEVTLSNGTKLTICPVEDDPLSDSLYEPEVAVTKRNRDVNTWDSGVKV